MGFRHITLIAGMLFAGNAMAITITPINANIPQAECDGKSTSFQSNIHDLQAMDLSQLIHKAASSKDVASVPLNEFRPKLLPQIQKHEADFARKAMGSCKCLFKGVGSKTTVKSESNCFLAGNRGSNKELNLNAHFAFPFLDENGYQKPGKLSCAFANNNGDAPVEFSFVPGTYRVGTMDDGDDAKDRAVVKLSAAIPGAAELPVLDGKSMIQEGMPLYLISDSGSQLIAQEVQVVKVYRDEFTGKVKAFATSGSAAPGTSASAYAMRDPTDPRNGLAVVGMVQGASKASRDGQPVFKTDPATGKPLLDKDGKPRLNNAIMAIPMDPDFTPDDRQMADDNNVRAALPSATKGL